MDSTRPRTIRQRSILGFLFIVVCVFKIVHTTIYDFSVLLIRTGYDLALMNQIRSHARNDDKMVMKVNKYNINK